MIISVVAAKKWYLQKCTVFIGPPCIAKVSARQPWYIHVGHHHTQLT